MITPSELKNYIHSRDFGKKEQLLLLLAATPIQSKKAVDIRSVAKSVGIRGANSWDISAIARGLQGRVIHGDHGWELTQSGLTLARQLLENAGYKISSPPREAATAPPTQAPSMADVEIFISHAAEDRESASNLVRLLVASLGIPKERIRCTSVPGCKLPSGADSSQTLAREIASAPIFIGLLTPNSVRSTYVLFELGARWAMTGRTIPILGPGADYGIIPAPIRARHALKTSIRTDMQQMLREVSSALGRTLISADAFEDELQALLDMASST